MRRTEASGRPYDDCGRDGEARITLDELAAACQTINYELACGFGMRLEKIYV